MGRASRKRAEQRSSVTAKVFSLERPPRRAPFGMSRGQLDRLAELRCQQLDLQAADR